MPKCDTEVEMQYMFHRRLWSRGDPDHHRSGYRLWNESYTFLFI